MPSLSIIIVNYKSWEVLKKNLDQLLSFGLKDLDFEIIVVDNCSNDGEFSAFEKKYEKVKFIMNTGNWGFAHACNLGAEHSLSEVLLFLNPDTLVAEAALKQLYAHFKNCNNIGILSCRTDDRLSSYQKVLPSMFTLFGPQRSIYKSLNRKQFDAINCEKCGSDFVSPEWISGSVIMISRAVFNKVGGWNPDYWMYSEDVELSKKLSDAGFDLRLLCSIKIDHLHGGASRLNIATSALTKAEVIISQHVYILNNFKKTERTWAFLLLAMNTLLFKSLFGLIGLLFCFVPKFKMHFLIMQHVFKYYFSVLKNKTWLSPRSFNFVKNIAA
jgi:GT2 family glycosyltransferase